jgi:hypothetical protein
MAALARSEMVAARASLCEEVMRRAKGTRSRTVLNPSAQQEVRLRGWGERPLSSARTQASRRAAGTPWQQKRSSVQPRTWRGARRRAGRSCEGQGMSLGDLLEFVENLGISASLVAETSCEESAPRTRFPAEPSEAR